MLVGNALCNNCPHMSLQSLASIHTVTVRRQAITKGATGAAIRGWQPLGTMQCRIQPINTASDDPYDRASVEYDNVMYFLADIYSLQPKDQILFGPKPRIFWVVGRRSFDELKRLYRAELQEILAKQ